jgi:hypothetical protein
MGGKDEIDAETLSFSLNGVVKTIKLKGNGVCL